MSRWQALQICRRCWAKANPFREPIRVLEAPEEPCCMCGADTDAGIYVRVDTHEVPFPPKPRPPA